MYTARKVCFFHPPTPKGALSFFSFRFICALAFLGRSPLKAKAALLESVFVRILLYHARALCARGKRESLAKDRGGKRESLAKTEK